MLIRLRLITVFFAITFLLLVGRLFYWQIYKGKELSVQARGQYHSNFTIDASRGEILASDGSWLASSSEAWLVFSALPEINESPKDIAEKLAPFFVEDVSERSSLLTEIDRLTTLLSKDDVVWIPLKQKVSSEVKERIEELDIKGIGFEVQEKRVYPEASTAAHLLGFVGRDEAGDDSGYFGLEGFYDVALSGKPGFKTREKDARGIPILLGTTREISAVRGVDLLTHIDKSVQLTLDKKLKEGIEKYGATGGVAVVMNPKDGSVLGMSSYPSYDPQKYWDFGDEFFNNPVISSTFEPGSVFKVVVMASALDAGVVNPDTICDICSGAVSIDKYTIETWNQVYRPNSSMVDVIVNSDNVGMVFVARRLGADRFYDYLKAFGIGSPTGIDLQGEANPKLREKGEWGSIDLATASFGQGVAVTPIQIASAVSTIANKGIRYNPQVVDKIVGDDWEEDLEAVGEKRVISEKAASEVTSMMVEAAKNGESKWTYVRGFNVAGKTGTAQIPIEGHYDEEKTIASFVGFAPYYDPKFVMLVTLKQPATSQWASETAAPLWYQIASDLFIHFGIQPEN